MVREALKDDLNQILELYIFLHSDDKIDDIGHLKEVWDEIIEDKNHNIIVNDINGKIVSSCVCVIIPNLTRNGRPYVFIENVVTHNEYRNKGYATSCLNYAKEIALGNKCYKMMLLTGSKRQTTLDFYKNAGYNSNDKTAFIQWLK